MKNKYISFGKILNFHGVKGEFKLGYTKGRESWVEKLDKVYIETVDSLIPATFQYVKFTPKSAVAKFKEFDNINDIIPLKGCVLYVEKDKAEENLSDLLSVKTKSGNISLVPFVKAIVTEVNINSRKITLVDMEGLLE